MIDYYYFNEEWNEEEDVLKEHPNHLIGSLTQYEPPSNYRTYYKMRATTRGMYDMYFHE